MQKNTYETPLNEYLYDGEYFLWTGNRTEIPYRFPLTLFLLIFSIILIIFLIIVTVSIVLGKCSFESLAAILVMAIGAFAARKTFKTDNEYYAVTNIRVMRLKGKSVIFENITSISDIKIYHEYNEKYAGIGFIMHGGRLNDFDFAANHRNGGRHFYLEKAEAEYVKQLIISQRDKLNNK